MELKLKDTVYYVRKLDKTNHYDILELKIRTANEEDQYYVGTEKRDKFCILFNVSEIGKTVFKERGYALDRALELELKGE